MGAQIEESSEEQRIYMGELARMSDVLAHQHKIAEMQDEINLAQRGPAENIG